MANIQTIIDIAVAKATKAALAGFPVERIIWIPPTSVTEDSTGAFAVMDYTPTSTTNTPPWELS